MDKSKKNISYYNKGFLVIILFLLIWECVVRLNWINDLVLPLPSKIFYEGGNLLSNSKFYSNFFSTLTNWSVSFVIGMFLGLAIGFISGLNSKFEQLILPITAFFRSVPPIALFPVFLILIGPGKLPIIVAGILGVIIYVFPIAHQSAETIKNKYQDLGHILKLSKYDFIKKIILPGTLINSFVSSRIAASYLFAVCIGGEIIIGGRKGIGAAILEYSEKYQLEEAYFYILIAGLLGLTLDLVISKFQNSFSLKQ
ncbi:MAG: ABC transporter permease subunit [bacterium]|nr:ABC transporter permease subunit [bacterium]